MDYKDIVSNVDIYDLEKSILASGYPMRTIIPDRDITEKDFQDFFNKISKKYADSSIGKYYTEINQALKYAKL